MTGTVAGATTLKASITKPGSSFMEQQIAFAVKDGRAVKVAGEILGWVMGMDTYHWGVVDSFGDVHLVHKSNTLILTEGLLDGYPDHVRATVEPKVTPYRDYVLKNYFQQASPAN